MNREPMFLNPVLSAKTYEVFNANGRRIGEVNDDSAKGAFEQARELYPGARFVIVKRFVSSLLRPTNQNHERKIP